MLKLRDFWNGFDGRAFWRELPYWHFLGLLIPFYAMILLVLGCFGGGDDAVYEFFKRYTYEHPDLSDALLVFTRCGNPFFYGLFGLFAVLALARRIDRRKFLSLALAYLVGELVMILAFGQLLKHTIGRPRPRLESDDFLFFTRSHNSMPSGHTYEMINSIGTLGFFRCWGLTLGGGLLLAAMGFSRIFLTAHFVSDVAAAPLVGIPAAILTLFLQKYFFFRLSAGND